MKIDNKKSFKYILSGLVSVGVISSTALAVQPSKNRKQTKTAARPAKSSVASKSAQTKAISSQQIAKRKTVGELLRQADRGAEIGQIEKSRTAISVATEALSAPRPQVNLSAVKPPRTSSFFEEANTDKAKLEKITDQQISELFKLTQQFKNSPQRGELWLRLAELYVEKSGIIDYRKQGEYDQALKEFQEGRRKVKPRLDLADAREYNKKAIQLYEWFVRDFPKDEKMDQALFFLGYNNYELGNLKAGTDYYTRLTSAYPRSPFVVEANFALGEYYFENEKWPLAKKYYEQVYKYKRHRLHNFSMYKLAWCQFRMGQSSLALKTMEALITESRAQSQVINSDGKKVLNKGKLESEGLRDIVLFYGEVGDSQSAPDYFNRLAGGDARGYLEKLAYHYGDKGNLEGARVVFNYLITQDPTSAKSFDYKYQIVKLYSTAKKSREFREELFSWVRNFAIGSAWYQANQGNKELIDSSYKLREQTLRAYVLQQHQTAQNSRAPFSQGLALEGYRLYLPEFKDSPVIADMHFYFGELLYDMKKFEEAGVQYRWVVDNGRGTKFYAKAGENSLLALEKELPSDDEIAKKVGTSIDPVEMDSSVTNFISSATQYMQLVPNNEKNVELKFRIGRLYYQHNQFDSAIPIFREIVTKHPRTKYAEYSANLLLDAYNLKKDYAGLEKTGTELMAMPGIANSQAGQDIKSVLEKSTFKRAQDLEVSKDYAGSALQFEAFAKQNPTSSLTTTASFNSAINYERAGNNSKAMQMHALVLASRDKNAEALKTKSRRIVAKLYQDAGKLEDAAATFRSSAVEAGKDPIAANLYFNAAVLFEAIGKNSEAIRNYEDYFERNKKSDRWEAVYQMATLYRKQGSISKASEKYQEYVGARPSFEEKVVESSYWIYFIAKQKRMNAEADQWRQRTLSLQKRFAPEKRGVGAMYAAKIKLEDANKSFDELRAIRIPANPANQQRAAQQKISMVSKLNNELADVIRYDSAEEIVGALSLLGQVNLHMGEALTGAPLPAGLNAEETKQYKAGIEKIAAPFIAKAKESFKAAVQRGSELDTYNSYYRKARQLALKLDSEAYYHGDEQTFDFKQGSWVGL